MSVIEIFALVVVLLSVVIFVISLPLKEIVVSENILKEISTEKGKKEYVFFQRIRILLYGMIALITYVFPATRTYQFIIVGFLIIVFYGGYLNKKYLGRIRLR